MYTQEEQSRLFELSKQFLKSGIALDKIEQLREILRFHEWKYYVQNDPILSDYEYDLLFKELQKFENNNPELITPDSPSQRVSSDLTKEFKSVRHVVPMLSLDNSYSAEDLIKFDEQVKKLTGLELSDTIVYCVEPKFDGGSIALLYENNILTRAATRGNGIEGEEMTANAKVLPSVPLKARFNRHNIAIAELRGEAVINKEKFKSLNQQREKEGLVLFANPRNSAAGGLRTKNPQETRKREIEIFAFHLAYAVDENGLDVLDQLDQHITQMKVLSELGFKTANPEKMLCQGIQEVIEKVNTWEEEREAYPYEIDGAVVKVDSRKLQVQCGSTQHHPRWAIAFKFRAKQATTQLLGVEYQVGKIGSITPVAKVEPTPLAGVTVSSISLHNEEFIRSKDLRIGDQIIIERAGDVIPYIVKPLKDLRNGTEQEIHFPVYCPINQTRTEVKLIQEEGEAAWRCQECVCGSQDLQRIIFHVSKDAMNIDGFGKSYVERFYDLGWIKDIGDIYNLNYEEIEKLEGFGTRSAEKLKSSIDRAKNNPISKLLYSLSIHHLGQKASKILSEQITSVFDLVVWEEKDYLDLKDIGPVVAKNAMVYFADAKNLELLRKLEAYGVNMRQTEEDKPLIVEENAPLKDKTILFTGSLQQMTRGEAKKLAEKAGGKNISAVSSKLNILVVGEKAGSKLDKATQLGTVQIMTEEEFIDLVS